MRACSSCGEENPDKAKFCSECAAPLTDAESPRETRKTVTVLFADMSGSTALGERLDPEALRVVIERYFDAMKGEIERHGGLVEKFIGDAVMAVFGIPKAHEDDALRAIRAAMGLHRVLAELNVDLERDHGVAIRVRVGINTGEVVTGDATERQRLVTGDTVNVAARFEQAATPGEVLIGRSTHRLVRDAVEVEPLAPLELKASPSRSRRSGSCGSSKVPHRSRGVPTRPVRRRGRRAWFRGKRPVAPWHHVGDDTRGMSLECHDTCTRGKRDDPCNDEGRGFRPIPEDLLDQRR